MSESINNESKASGNFSDISYKTSMSKWKTLHTDFAWNVKNVFKFSFFWATSKIEL